MDNNISVGSLVVLDSPQCNYVVRNAPFLVTHLANSVATCVAVDRFGSPIGGSDPDFQIIQKVRKSSVIAILESIQGFDVFIAMNKKLDSHYTAYLESERRFATIKGRIKSTGVSPCLSDLSDDLVGLVPVSTKRADDLISRIGAARVLQICKDIFEFSCIHHKCQIDADGIVNHNVSDHTPLDIIFTFEELMGGLVDIDPTVTNQVREFGRYRETFEPMVRELSFFKDLVNNGVPPKGLLKFFNGRYPKEIQPLFELYLKTQLH